MPGRIAKKSRRFDHRPMFHVKHFLMGVGVGSLEAFLRLRGLKFSEVIGWEFGFLG